MFTGMYEYNVDSKGRLSIPSRFRDLLSAQGINQLTVTRGTEKCLFVYIPEQWSEVKEKLQKVPLSNKNGQYLSRRLLGAATACVINEQGRINIPAVLLKKAGIEKEAVILGLGNRLEIWDKTIFEEYDESNENFLEGLEGLNI